VAGISWMRWVIPNLLSVIRIILAIVFPFAPVRSRAGIVVVAAMSDLFDGALSRWLHATSAAGQILDPIADKLFVASILVTLLVEGRVRLAEVALVEFRDLTVLAGSATVVLRRGWASVPHLKPTLLGKLATALQFLFMLTVVTFAGARTLVLIPTAIVSVIAGIAYVRGGELGRHRRGQ